MQSSYARSTKRFAYALIAPVVAIMLLVIVFPVLDTARLSFFDATFIKPGLDAPFIGFKNYFSALNDKLFWRALWITVKWTIASIVFQFALGFGLALLVNCKVRGAKVIRSLYLIPWMLPGALAALMWKWMYHGSIGLLNYVLLQSGLANEPIPWLSKPETVLWAAVLVNVWRGAPFFMIMLLGGLQTISYELYESAQIDGANFVQRFLHITIPLLRPLILTLFIYGTVGAFNFLDIVLVLTGGGPANHSLVLPLYAWRSAFFDMRIGYAATISVLMCLVLGGFVLTAFRLKAATRDFI